MTYKLFLGDCLEFMKTMPDKSVVCVTDPPYGKAIQTNYKERKRGALADCNDFPPIVGDDKPFDPYPILEMNFRTVVLFGADNYADKLRGGSWYIWDKLDGLISDREFGFNDNSDCEFIWCNHPGASRIFRSRWMGAIKNSERNERRVHPTQKPISLMAQLILYFTDKDDVIFDPYMGSGASIVAALQLGRSAIGVEISPDYFAIAKNRIERAAMQEPLFT